MVREIVKDTMLLMRKASPASKADLGNGSQYDRCE